MKNKMHVYEIQFLYILFFADLKKKCLDGMIDMAVLQK